MAAETRGYAQRVDIRADIEVVWNALIEPATLAIWYAPGARVDAREGGLYSARHGENLQREAHIDVFLPPRRLRLIYMPFPDLPDEGAVVVEDFLLDRDPAAARAHNISAVTVLRLMGSGVPERRLDCHLCGPAPRLGARPAAPQSAAREGAGPRSGVHAPDRALAPR